MPKPVYKLNKASTITLELATNISRETKNAHCQIICNFVKCNECQFAHRCFPLHLASVHAVKVHNSITVDIFELDMYSI